MWHLKNRNKHMKKFIYLAVLILIAACGGGREYKKNPVDTFIRDMADETTFSIILHDMDVEGTFMKSYRHQYQIITEKDSLPVERITDWMEVPEKYFWKNENNMGMEIASKNSEGKVSKVASPPGYSNYVGNSRYGSWNRSGGNSFWVWYGQYAFMSNMFHMSSRPIYRSEYRDYRSGGYYGTRAYYGPKGKAGYKYGTNSSYNKTKNPNFFQRRANKTGWSKSSSRTGRSGSRYSGGSSRSRGGGFGK